MDKTVQNALALKDPREGVLQKEISNIPAFRKDPKFKLPPTPAPALDFEPGPTPEELEREAQQKRVKERNAK